MDRSFQFDENFIKPGTTRSHGDRMPIVRNIFFDLDGTLTDPKIGFVRCITHTLKMLEFPCPSDAELIKWIGPPLRSTFEKLLCSNNNDLIERAVSLYRQRYSKLGFSECSVYPGVSQLLEALFHNAFRLFIVTSKPTVFAERIARLFGFDRWITDVFGPELDGRFDNKTSLIHFLFQNLALKPEDTLMIGDRREDIVAGRGNQTVTMGVTYGYGSVEEIINAGPDHICNNPSEIWITVTKG